jgi:hypothetical protein
MVSGSVKGHATSKSENDKPEERMSDTPRMSLPGIVERIIKSPSPSEADKAQITVDEGDHRFRDIRIDNTLKNESGDDVSLKLGAHVEITVMAKAMKKATPL